MVKARRERRAAGTAHEVRGPAAGADRAIARAARAGGGDALNVRPAGAARLRVGLALGLALALSACAQFPTGSPAVGSRGPVVERAEGFPLPVARPALHVGDRWVWSAHEVGENASDDTTVIERVVASVSGDRAELRQVTLHPVTRRPTGAPQTRVLRRSVWHLQPNTRSQGEIKALVFPLAVGKTWEYEYWLGGRERDLVTTYHYRARVDGVEIVRTPAGRFETLRVTHEGRWSRPVMEHGLPVERRGDVRTTYWYAPAVGTWVRLEVDLRRPDGSRDLGIVQELVEYTVGR